MTSEQIEQMKAALAGATKGPWSASKFCGEISGRGGEKVSARTSGPQANARLIALAPDMAAHIIAALEARVKAAEKLAEVVNEVVQDAYGYDWLYGTAFHGHVYETLNPALAAFRATGEQT